MDRDMDSMPWKDEKLTLIYKRVKLSNKPKIFLKQFDYLFDDLNLLWELYKYYKPRNLYVRSDSSQFFSEERYKCWVCMSCQFNQGFHHTKNKIYDHTRKLIFATVGYSLASKTKDFYTVGFMERRTKWDIDTPRSAMKYSSEHSTFKISSYQEYDGIMEEFMEKYYDEMNFTNQSLIKKFRRFVKNL